MTPTQQFFLAALYLLFLLQCFAFYSFMRLMNRWQKTQDEALLATMDRQEAMLKREIKRLEAEMKVLDGKTKSKTQS